MTDDLARQSSGKTIPPVLATGETVVATFAPSRATYVKEHIMLAAIASVAGAGLLIFAGSEHAWTGVVGALAAIAVRGIYVASEALGQTWTLTDRRLIAPSGMNIPRARIARARTIFSAAQVITDTGDKHMIKYLSDPAAAVRIIEKDRT
ncbi:hypothetical protein [uncultured Maritimibacter sp.]|jgi:hypothetical protein|uniref:hypothetical protein n=1 Tax=uncultured Maritimibacter sp. TaxID=991866 RepID=UPI0026214CE7|nr:hypothetical protein [uncultured Maritimibacter sp.]